jgi:hypothetical protein
MDPSECATRVATGHRVIRGPSDPFSEDDATAVVAEAVEGFFSVRASRACRSTWTVMPHSGSRTVERAPPSRPRGRSGPLLFDDADGDVRGVQRPKPPRNGACQGSSTISLHGGASVSEIRRPAGRRRTKRRRAVPATTSGPPTVRLCPRAPPTAGCRAAAAGTPTFPE